jgi:tRNA (guanine37-N1)-methyltransferase
LYRGKLKVKRNYDEVIFMTPDGEKLNQNYTNQLSLKKNILFFVDTTKELTKELEIT